MNLHSLVAAAGQKKNRKRVGRGRASGSGKTGGRGQKGQMSRKGHKHKDGFEGGQMKLIRRIPKRGFKRNISTVYVPVNVGVLSLYNDGAAVTPSSLKERGIVRNSAKLIKILGDGDLGRKLSVKAHAFSAGARSKIEGAGGSCEVIAE